MRSSLRSGPRAPHHAHRAMTTLVAILHSPPATPGARTRQRLQIAMRLLGHEELTVANIFPLTTQSSVDPIIRGASEAVWLEARAEITEALQGATSVLLGYGVAEPAGSARHHFRAQVEWLTTQLTAVGAPVWNVGGAPRHPTRWHRHTRRAHPQVDFIEALRRELQQQPRQSLNSHG